MSHNVSHVKYNLLNLPDHVYMQSGNGMSFGPLTWRNGILTRYDFPGGFFNLYDDENELPSNIRREREQYSITKY